MAPAHKHAKEGTDIVALALAAFMRYAAGTDASGEPLELVDPLTDALRPIAVRAYAGLGRGCEWRRRRPAGTRPGHVRDTSGTRRIGGGPCIGDPAAAERGRLEATRAFVETIFGAEVAGWDAFVANVFEHADRSHRSTVRGCGP